MFTCLVGAQFAEHKQKKEPHQSVVAAIEAVAIIQILGYVLPCASQTFTDVPAIRIRWTIILALQLSDVLDIRI